MARAPKVTDPVSDLLTAFFALTPEAQDAFTSAVAQVRQHPGNEQIALTIMVDFLNRQSRVAVATPAAPQTAQPTEAKRKGRPVGSKNKPKARVTVLDERPDFNDPAFPDERYYVGDVLYIRGETDWIEPV